jgi:hypothetical protein
MKKKITIIIVSIFFLVFVSLILCPRSLKKAQTIAEQELYTNLHDRKIKELKGPLIDNQKESVEFIWYKELEWGDTSKIFIKVHKNIFLVEKNESWWRNILFFWEPQVTMNYQWYYFLFPDGTSSFEDVFPLGAKGIELMLNMKTFPNDTISGGNIELVIPADRLIYFIKKGYFEVLQKEKDTTIVAFYEPIARMHLQNKSSVSVMTAKVLSIDTIGIAIIPINAHEEAWN